MTPDFLLSNLESIKNDKDYLINSLKSVVKCSLLKEFVEGNERPCQKNDFEDHLKYIENDVEALKLVFKKLVEENFFFENSEKESIGQTQDLNSELLTLFCVLCGENNSLQPWNSELVVNNCSIILGDILKLYNCSSTVEFFSKKIKRNLTKNILETLHPKLMSSNWKNFPAAVSCYKWILESIMQPELSSYLPLVIPTSLLLVDDFVLENRILGIECLSHIISNVTSVELQFCGYGDVIYSALEPLLRVREEKLMNFLLPCLINLTIKLEMSFGKEKNSKWSKFDNILEVYLENMEMEQLIDLRSIYISYLQLLIRSSGFSSIRWSKRLFRIFREYLQIGAKHNDNTTIRYSLMAIQEFMMATEKLIQLYAKELLLILFIVFCINLQNSEQNKSLENKKLAEKLVLDLFEKMSEDGKKDMLNEIKEKFEENHQFKQSYTEIKNVLKLKEIAK